MRGTARGTARMRERRRTRRDRERMEKRPNLCGLAVGFGGARTAIGGASLDVGTNHLPFPNQYVRSSGSWR